MSGSASRTYTLDETKPSKTITIRQRAYEPKSEKTFNLRPSKYATQGWEVFREDGVWIGTVSRYTGSLDRKAGRLRIPGKTRTLWAATGTYQGARGLYGMVSRADAIRYLDR
jgi:hypothetical protein